MRCVVVKMNSDLYPKTTELPNAETWVQSRSCLCGVCGRQSGTVTGPFLPIVVPQMLHYVISCPSLKR
jgi:hypothetical protein